MTIRQGSMDLGGMAMMSAGLFLITWLMMMAAMMFPSVAPMVLVYGSVTRSRGEGILPTATFVIGYLLVWTAAGLVPALILQAFNQMWIPTPSWLPRVGGAVVILAGIYQFTPLKSACLRACRSPLGFIMTHGFGGGIMNIAWMAVIAAVFFVEKNVRGGQMLPKAVGVACIVAGLALVIWPSPLTGMSAM